MEPRFALRRGDEEIARVATAQDGVIARRQLEALGLGERAITQRLTSGRLHTVHFGVYAVGHERITRRGLRIAAVLACGSGAALSRRSSAAARDWRIGERGAIDVLVPDRSRRQHAGIRIHRPIALSDTDIEDVGGIPTHQRREDARRSGRRRDARESSSERSSGPTTSTSSTSPRSARY